MAIWLTDTSRPRRCAGAISAIYIGVDMEAMPMPMPPSQRNRMKVQMSRGSAVPMAETRNSSRRQQQRLLAPEPVRDGPDDQHARRAADQHAAGRPALHHHVELEARGQEFDGAGDDARVVAEEQAAQRGDQADRDEVGEVGANRRRRSAGRRCGNWHGPHFLRQGRARQWLCATASRPFDDRCGFQSRPDGQLVDAAELGIRHGANFLFAQVRDNWRPPRRSAGATRRGQP